jgi:multidrug resistance efflux pump
MLLLLALIYASFVWLLFFKLKLLPWNRVSMIIVGVIGVAGLSALWFTLQNTSPFSDDVTVSAYVVEIVPRVTGRIENIYVRPNTPVKKGAPLLKIDDRPYLFALQKLEAVLVGSRSGVSQLGQRLAASRAQTEQARAGLLVAQADAVRAPKERLDAAVAAVAQTKANRDAAQLDLQRLEQAAKSEAVPRITVDQKRREVESLSQALNQAEANARGAQVGVESGYDRLGAARASVGAALANEQRARLALEAQISGENFQVSQVYADLDQARYNLSETVLYAPDDGYLTYMPYRPGSYATLNQVLGYFVVTSEWPAVMNLRDNAVRFVRPGPKAEIALNAYPGRLLKGEVVAAAPAGQGQYRVTPMTGIPDTQYNSRPGFLPVRLRLNPDPSLAPLQLGMKGSAAIYTGAGNAVSIVRRIPIRVDAWTNYIF